MFYQNRQQGFTLIELLVVISIITLLSSIIMSSFSVVRSQNRDRKRQGDVAQIKLAVELYHQVYGIFPPARSADGTEHPSPTGDLLIHMEQDLKPFMPVIPVDPINEGLYQYEYVRRDPTQGGGFGIRVAYEAFEDDPYDICRTGFNMHPGWWGPSEEVPTCEDVL